MPVRFHPSTDMGSNNVGTLLSRTGPTANQQPFTTQNDIVEIFQQEQEHALSLLSLSPLLSSLFLSYARRASGHGSASATASADSEEWKVLQNTIKSLREENEKLRVNSREMIRKLEMSEASQAMLRSQVSSVNEANGTYRDDINTLRAELIELRIKYGRILKDSEAEKNALKVQISDIEKQRGQLRETAVKQQIRISKLERPAPDVTFRGPNSPPFRGDSDSTPSPTLPDSPITPFQSSLPTFPSPYVDSEPACMSPTSSAVGSLRSHPLARGGLIPGRPKAIIVDTQSITASSGWFADGD